MNNINTNYKDIINSFVLNTVLHNFGMPWINETHGRSKYYINKHNLDWIRGGPCYNISICKKYMEQCLNHLL